MGVAAISGHTSDSTQKSISYKDAGVNIDAASLFVGKIKPHANNTNRLGVISGLGGFGGLFDLKAAGYKDPILVAATDGVGTKLKIAHEAKLHTTVGIDLVGMCVNDLIVQAAEPLFFLDYLATGKLDTEIAIQVVEGIANGCRQAGCALIGGETAEMPGIYAPSDYDLAGFAVGAVERNALIPRDDIQEHDVILGLASNGLHSNGFSLVRKVVNKTGLDFNRPAPFDPNCSLAEALLTPTRIYIKSCLAAISEAEVKALAHITGGGLIENVPRILPDGLGASFYAKSWEIPTVFKWLAKTGRVTPREMARTFNCGIGMTLIVSPEKAAGALTCLKEHGETARSIGKVVEIADGSPRITIHDLPEALA